MQSTQSSSGAAGLDEATLEVIRRIRPQMYARVLDDRLNKAKTYIDISSNSGPVTPALDLKNSTRLRQYMQTIFKTSQRSIRSTSENVNGAKTEINESK